MMTHMLGLLAPGPDDSIAGGGSGNCSENDQSFYTKGALVDLEGLKESLSLSEGNLGTNQLAGIYKDIKPSGYERHHIPSVGALKAFGVDTKSWPTILLTKDDHAKTDSYREKQRSKYDSIFPDDKRSDTYKDSAIELMNRDGGFVELVRDEIYNIREQCGEKYDGAISQFLDVLKDHILKHGIPRK